MKNFGILIFLSFCFCNRIYSQSLEWIVYDTTNSGLPSSWVYYLTIDESDNKWMCSHTYLGFGGHHGDGLIKYDNSEWTVYDTLNSGLKSNTVSDVVTDEDGNVWIATEFHVGSEGWGNNGGIVKFDGSKWTNFDTRNSDIPTNDIKCIEIDNSGYKWIGTSSGLVQFNDTDWTVYTSNFSVPISNLINCIAFDDQGNNWLGTGSALVKFDGIDWIVKISFFTQFIEIDDAGYIWAGPSPYGGIEKGDGTFWNTYNMSNSGIPSNYVSCIAIDGSGNKWIGTDSGLTKFDGTIWTTYNKLNSGLPDNRIYCISIDRYGNKWIGTYPGLAVFNEGGIVSVNEKDKLKRSLLSSFQLSQNYPNPFNPSTKIRYSIPQSSNVVIKVFDILGNEIETLVNEEKPVGVYEVEFEGGNLSSGVYFYQLTAGNFIEMKKMLLIK